jgi:hypothetical protein
VTAASQNRRPIRCAVEGLSATKRSGTAKLSWWHAGGLHAHVTYPDGSTMHKVWPAASWWEIDALRMELENEFQYVDVKP